MTSLLSSEQRQALKEHPADGPLRILDDATQDRYVLIPGAAYDRIRALFEEEPFDSANAAPLIDEVAAKEGWDDAAMDVYDDLYPRRHP